jgi:hypothetical protein
VHAGVHSIVGATLCLCGMVFEKMKSELAFKLGVVLLIIALVMDGYIYFAIVRPVVEIGLIGDIPWSTLTLGIILTAYGYMKKGS